MIKASIEEESITFVNKYAFNLEVPTYIKQILTDLNREIDRNTIIVGDFNLHLHQRLDNPDRKSIRKNWT